MAPRFSKSKPILSRNAARDAISHSGGFIEDKNAILPIDAAIQSSLRETSTRVLTAREGRVLRMRFGIGMNTDPTLEQVGLQFSVTRERIRQIEANAHAEVSERVKHEPGSGRRDRGRSVALSPTLLGQLN
jgi:DNA-directed RNA polymerase sigma subunit (sigma70/sigma32)